MVAPDDNAFIQKLAQEYDFLMQFPLVYSCLSKNDSHERLFFPLDVLCYLGRKQTKKRTAKLYQRRQKNHHWTAINPAGFLGEEDSILDRAMSGSYVIAIGSDKEVIAYIPELYCFLFEIIQELQMGDTDFFDELVQRKSTDTLIKKVLSIPKKYPLVQTQSLDAIDYLVSGISIQTGPVVLSNPGSDIQQLPVCYTLGTKDSLVDITIVSQTKVHGLYTESFPGEDIRNMVLQNIFEETTDDRRIRKKMYKTYALLRSHDFSRRFDTSYHKMIFGQLLFAIIGLYELHKDNIRILLDTIQEINFSQFRVSHNRMHARHNIQELFGSEFYRDGRIAILFQDPSFVGGGFMIYSDKDPIVREYVDSFIQSYTKQHPKSSLLYRSVGSVQSTYQVMQFLSLGKKFELHPRGHYILSGYVGKDITGDYETLRAKPYDVILDEVTDSIVIAGNEVTRKEMTSKSMTIQVLKILLQHINTPISHKLLPVSSYSKSKNEMYSKIVSPLKKIIKKYTDKDIDLQCRGKLYDFQLQLGESDVTIAILGFESEMTDVDDM